jgi:murein DD-endopeptidase MepM/ murein hydrolase activator NlpD
MRSVVGPLPPPVQRPSARGFRRRRQRPHPRPRRGTRIPARTFAIVAFVVWGAVLALFDWGLGGLRHPRPLTARLGAADGPPAVMFPEPAEKGPALTPAVSQPPRGASGAAATVARWASATELPPLVVPVAGVAREDLRDQFDEPRGGGRRHEAIDILAPRNSPVVAAADGVVDKLFTSKAGGLTIYERDPSGLYQLYYAHLESYAPGIAEGDVVQQGQVIGYVGTSGNAPKDVPHLHFAVFRMGPDRRWWKGEAVNPFPLLARR